MFSMIGLQMVGSSLSVFHFVGADDSRWLDHLQDSTLEVRFR